MTKREIAALACRVLALYAAIGAFDSLAAFFANVIGAPTMSLVYGTPSFTNTVAFLLPGAIRLLVAGALWFFADGLAAAMVKNDGKALENDEANVDFKSLAFSILGAFVLVGATARLGQIMTRFIVESSQARDIHRDYSGLSAPEIVAALITFALGLWLLLGARGVARWIASLRNIGRDSSTKPFVDETTSV